MARRGSRNTPLTTLIDHFMAAPLTEAVQLLTIASVLVAKRQAAAEADAVEAATTGRKSVGGRRMPIVARRRAAAVVAAVAPVAPKKRGRPRKPVDVALPLAMTPIHELPSLPAEE